MARILCISDIHLGSSDNLGIYAAPTGAQDVVQAVGYDKTKELINNIKALQNKIDLIAFCGDYVTGKDSSGVRSVNYDKFSSLLSALEKEYDDIFSKDMNIPIQHRILILPGNHDIDRDAKIAPLNDFKNVTRGYLTPYNQATNGVCEFAPVFIFDELKLIIACMSTVESSATKNTKVSELLELIESESLSDNFKKEISNYLKGKLKTDYASIHDNDRTHFIRQCEKISKIEKYNCYKKILITHHPLINGIQNIIVGKENHETLGGSKLLMSAAEYGFLLFIHGHSHNFSCFEFCERINYNDNNIHRFMQIGVPECRYDDDKNGVICIDMSGDDINIDLLKLNDRRKAFTNPKSNPPFMKKTYSENFMHGILTDKEIERLIREAKIVKNGDISGVEAASYDCRLGYTYKRHSTEKCGDFPNWESISPEKLEAREDALPAQIVLEPGETALIFTFEEFDIPTDMVLHASPISSWVRRGLRVDISFFVDPGFEGPFCFPVTNITSKPLSISSKEPIMSVEFVQLAQTASRSWKDRHPEAARRRKDGIE